ncbi:MAG TPA: sodium/proline symporter PutP [Thiotrichales bacterium]|nr:sodium/proline symporter PutP [Thiotrichales bacterium]
MNPASARFDPVVAWTILAYVAVMTAIGVVAWRRTADLSDFILGGRRLGRWVTALSAEASDMSGWLLLGLPGLAYASGLESVWLAGGLLAGTWLNWRFMAARLRTATVNAGDALTLPDYFERRFADPHRVLRVVSASLILFFFTFYTSSGLTAGARLFETVFGVDYHIAVALGAGAILAYTFLGGFLAVSWTDLVQGLLMLFALLAVPVVLLEALGGWQTAQARIAAINPALVDPFTDATGEPLGLIAILSLLGWGLGYFGQPHILARFMAIRDPAEIGPARRIAVTWVALSLGGALLVGLLAIPHLQPALEGPDTEKVFIHLVGALFHPLLAGILLSAVLAAVMSTADSQLLVASSALTEDLYRPFLRPRASQVELVWVGRTAVAVIALLASILAWNPQNRVLDLVAYAWGGFGAAFGPSLLLSLYWRRMTRQGALAGLLVGGATVIVWSRLQGGWFDLYELVPGFVLSALAVVLVSLLSAQKR